MKRINLIYGKTGTGKTTLVKHLIKDIKRVIVIDMMNEYNSPFIIINDFESLADYVSNHSSFQISCRFSSELEIEYTFLLTRIIENVTLVVEEASIYISPGARQSSFLDLARFGRHNNVQIVGVSRRASELSSDFRALTEYVISLKQTEPLDLKILSQIGFNGLENLEQFVYTPTQKVPILNKHYLEKIL